MLGGYVSGVSLIAAPLVVPVAAGRMPREQLRDTLFVLWFILVGLKLGAFVASGVDMQWGLHLWLLPCATIGHFLGLRFHRYTLRADTTVFFRYLGLALLAVGFAGVVRLLLF
jgi:FtsH-binding integral membrane protein